MGNPLQPYNYRKAAQKNVFDDYNVSSSDFQIKGHPGKYDRVVSVQSGSVASGFIPVADFTGSNYGAIGLLVTAATTGTASLAGGGDIDLSLLAVDTMYDFSVSRVVEDGGEVVYVFIDSGKVV